MLDQSMKQPVYTEQVGQSTAEVYHYRGIYSVLLMGNRVACFLGNSTSLEDCKEGIKSLKELFIINRCVASPSSLVKGSTQKAALGH